VRPPCTAQTCGDGCCLDGVCMHTTSQQYCGVGGQACFACASGNVCSFGRCEPIALPVGIDSDSCTIHLARVPVTVARPLTAVWAGAATAWAVGPAGAMVLDGDRLVPPPTDAAIGTGLKAVWSAGDGAPVWMLRGTVDAAIRREMPGLSLDEESPTGAALNAIWGRRDDDVWVVGDEGRAAHWDGTSWSTHQPATEALIGLAGQANGMAYAVTASKLFHEEGGRFVPVDAAPARLTGALALAGPYSVWAAGEEGVLHPWDDGRWSSTKVGLEAPGGVWMQSRTAMFFTQPGGIGFMGSGTTSFVPFRLGLSAISGTTPNRALAVGAEGAVLGRCAEPEELPKDLNAGTGAGTSGGGGGTSCSSYCTYYTWDFGCIAYTHVCH